MAFDSKIPVESRVVCFNNQDFRNETDQNKLVDIVFSPNCHWALKKKSLQYLRINSLKKEQKEELAGMVKLKTVHYELKCKILDFLPTEYLRKYLESNFVEEVLDKNNYDSLRSKLLNFFK